MNKDVEDYLSALPDDRRAMVNELHAMIVGMYPDITVDMQYKMPTYHQGDGWVALANQKNYVSLYTCGAHHLEKFKVKQPKGKTGKGCINLKPADPLPREDLREVVRHAIEHPKGEWQSNDPLEVE